MDTEVRTWLYRITLNHCSNLRQAWPRRNIHTVADESVFLRPGPRPPESAAGSGDQGTGRTHSAGAG